MKTMQIVVEGISEKQVMENVKKNLKGWKLLLQEPKGASYEFFNPFFGHSWDGTAENLRKIITTYGKIGEHQKHMILRFQWDGNDRFAWCSWERVLYDCKTDIKHPVEPKYVDNMIQLIKNLF